jgi:dephospho-CoA kinase
MEFAGVGRVHSRMTSMMSSSVDHNPASSFVPLQIGLTGSIGMGKSTIASHFKTLGFPVFDADAEVHKMYDRGGDAVGAINDAFPGVVTESGMVDRGLLGASVLSNAIALKTLEGIVHPLVKEKREIFLQSMAADGHFLVLYDIPLLFEKPELQDNIDYTIVTSADAQVQEKRVLERPGMTKEKFKSILTKQMPDAEKRGKADFIVTTDSPNLALAKAQVAKVLESIIDKEPIRWDQWKQQYNKGMIYNTGGASSGGASNSIIAEKFAAVVFDLDDTLVPVMGPVTEASKVLEHYMETKFQKTREKLGAEYMVAMREEIKRLAAADQRLSHDLTSLRRVAMENLFHEEEKHHIDQFMDDFIRVRSQVDRHLFDDVMPCVTWLREQLGVKVGVLTNGNANLALSELLGKSAVLDPSLILNAGDVGVLKPSPVAFMALAQRGGFNAGSVLYIGDNFEHDAIGARRSGMHSAYLRRRTGVDNSKDEDIDTDGHIVIESLHPFEIEAKVKAFFTSLHSSSNTQN